MDSLKGAYPRKRENLVLRRYLRQRFDAAQPIWGSHVGATLFFKAMLLSLPITAK